MKATHWQQTVNGTTNVDTREILAAIITAAWIVKGVNANDDAITLGIYAADKIFDHYRGIKGEDHEKSG